MYTPNGLKTPVGKVICDWLDQVNRNSEAVSRWFYGIIGRSREDSELMGIACEICGSVEGLQLHHLAGRKHCYLTITVCKSCHDELTMSQKTWDKRWWQNHQPTYLRETFLLMGIADVLKLYARKRGYSIHEGLAMQFTEEISKRLRR